MPVVPSGCGAQPPALAQPPRPRGCAHAGRGPGHQAGAPGGGTAGRVTRGPPAVRNLRCHRMPSRAVVSLTLRPPPPPIPPQAASAAAHNQRHQHQCHCLCRLRSNAPSRTVARHCVAATDAVAFADTRDGNRSGYYPDRTGPDRTGYGFGPPTQIPGPGIYYPPSTRTRPNIPGPDRMYLYLETFA